MYLWEDLLVVPRSACTEVHGLPKKMHCLSNTFRTMAKVNGDPYLRKLVNNFRITSQITPTDS